LLQGLPSDFSSMPRQRAAILLRGGAEHERTRRPRIPPTLKRPTAVQVGVAVLGYGYTLRLGIADKEVTPLHWLDAPPSFKQIAAPAQIIFPEPRLRCEPRATTPPTTEGLAEPRHTDAERYGEMLSKQFLATRNRPEHSAAAVPVGSSQADCDPTPSSRGGTAPGRQRAKRGFCDWAVDIQLVA